MLVYIGGDFVRAGSYPTVLSGYSIREGLCPGEFHQEDFVLDSITLAMYVPGPKPAPGCSFDASFFILEADSNCTLRLSA